MVEHGFENEIKKLKASHSTGQFSTGLRNDSNKQFKFPVFTFIRRKNETVRQKVTKIHHLQRWV